MLSRLAEVEWQTAKLNVQDRLVKIGEKETFQTNVVGEVYDHLNRVRNDFRHGNPVSAETLKLVKRQESGAFLRRPVVSSCAHCVSRSSIARVVGRVGRSRVQSLCGRFALHLSAAARRGCNSQG